MLALIAGVFLLAGGIKGLIGVGLPTVAIALLLNVMPLREAMPLIVLPAIVTNIWQAFVGGRLLVLIRRFWPLLLLLVVGTWIGVGILAGSNQHLLVALFGVILIIYALLGLFHPIPNPPGRIEPWLTPPIGFVNGILNGLTGSYILPGTLYLQSLRLPRDELIQAMGLVYLVASSALGFSLTGHNVMGWQQAAVSAGALLPAMIGYAAGQHYRRRMPEEQFRRVFFIGLLCLGLYMFVTRIFF